MDSLPARARRPPVVSVVIPVYNHEAFVGKAIESVLSQSYRNLEVLAIDDGSTDRSVDVLRSFRDPRLRVFTQKNHGAHHTLNKGVRLATGKYISILNSDDIYHRSRVARFVDICERDPGVAACFSYIDIVDEKEHVVGHIDGPAHNAQAGQARQSLRHLHDPLLDLLGGNYLATTSNLFCRRTVFRTLGLFRSFRYAHDFDFFVRLCAKHRVQQVKRTLLLYRTHRTNTIKENRAATHFEHALILSGVLSDGVFRRVLKPGGDAYDTLARFFSSVDAFGSEKVVLTLLLAQLQAGRPYNRLCRDLIDNPDNPLRQRCIQYLQRDRGATAEDRIARAMQQWAHEARPDRDVYLFGTGAFSRLVRKHMDPRRFRPVGYFDNNPAVVGRRIQQLAIESPRMVPGAAVIIASGAQKPIYRQLRQLGYKPADIMPLPA